jgi:threonine dehydrogenase-like Zn-dependent dehydrogenase
MAAYSAILRGASSVYSSDYVPEQLRLTSAIGSIPINFRDTDPVEQILVYEPNGIARSVDAVGYEQVNRNVAVSRTSSSLT